MLALTTFAELAAALKLKEEPEDYPALTSLQASVYAAFESYLGRHLELDEYTDTGYLYGERTFSLRAMPVVSVSAVTVGGVDYTASATARLDSIVLPVSCMGTISVTYDGGLEEAPAIFRRAAFMQTVYEWQRKDHMGATSVVNDGGSTSWPELSLLKQVRLDLDPYTHPARLI